MQPGEPGPRETSYPAGPTQKTSAQPAPGYSPSPAASPLAPILALIVNAFVWGVSWWPFRQLQGYGLHPLWTTALVYLIVTSCLLLVHFKAWRGFVTHPQLWFLALAAGFTNIGFNWAVTVGDVVRVVLLFYLMPAWAVLVAWVMLGEKPTVASLLRLLLALAGVFIVLKKPDSPWPFPEGAADWLAIMGGFSFAVTNALLRKHAAAPSSSRMLAMFAGSGLLAVCVALFGMSQQLLPAPALQTGGLPALLLISLGFIASNAALQYGAARLAGSVTAIVMLTEIIFASVSSALLGAASMEPQVLIGGALIVVAAMLAAIAPGSPDATGAKSL